MLSRFTPSPKADLMSWSDPVDREAPYIGTWSRAKEKAKRYLAETDAVYLVPLDPDIFFLVSVLCIPGT